MHAGEFVDQLAPIPLFMVRHGYIQYPDGGSPDGGIPALHVWVQAAPSLIVVTAVLLVAMCRTIRRWILATQKLLMDQSMTLTFSACGPFWPWVMSNSTRCPRQAAVPALP